MTKDEIKTTFPGAQIQLAGGQIADVKSIDTSEEIITLQYDDELVASTASGDAGSKSSVSVGWMMQTQISSEGAVDPNPPMPLAVSNESGTSPTTIKCKWVELANATKLT